MMFKDNYNNRVSKFITTQKPNNLKVSEVVAKVCTDKLCNCPKSEPGKISAHEPGCHIRERLRSSRYTINTSVTPRKFNDGCNLGVVLTD